MASLFPWPSIYFWEHHFGISSVMILMYLIITKTFQSCILYLIGKSIKLTENTIMFNYYWKGSVGTFSLFLRRGAAAFLSASRKSHVFNRSFMAIDAAQSCALFAWNQMLSMYPSTIPHHAKTSNRNREWQKLISLCSSIKKEPPP